MLAWMDDEALRLTRETGEAHFWSRSRQQLWRKGETLGQHARGRGAARRLRRRRDPPPRAPERARLPHGRRLVLRAVALADDRRARARAAGGLVRRAPARRRAAGGGAKVGEEGVEAALAGAGESDERLVEELADLWFHSYVLLAARGLDPSAVEDELRRRHAERSCRGSSAEMRTVPPNKPRQSASDEDSAWANEIVLHLAVFESSLAEPASELLVVGEAQDRRHDRDVLRRDDSRRGYRLYHTPRNRARSSTSQTVSAEAATGSEDAGELRRRLLRAAEIQPHEVPENRIERSVAERERLGVAVAEVICGWSWCASEIIASQCLRRLSTQAAATTTSQP